LYWCETWSLIVRGEHTLRVFENKMPRKIYGPKGAGETKLSSKLWGVS
jgi:hypothetical protein